MNIPVISQPGGPSVELLEKCVQSICFVPFDRSSTRFFGFSEFLAGLALSVLAWTIADVRYRFRIRTAPVPLQGITYVVVGAVGLLSLLTDLWRAESWLVPIESPVDAAQWQALLGGILFLTFLVWVWYAFISPPIFGEWNAARYARALFRIVLRSSPPELAEISDELSSSVASIVGHATSKDDFQRRLEREAGQGEWDQRSEVTKYADDILLLIADKRFCRTVVDTSPGTALAIFTEIGRSKKYNVDIDSFGRNILKAALDNKGSFLFHEVDGFDSGLLGYFKPLSHAIYGDYPMVEAIGALLDPGIWNGRMDPEQLKAYCRVVLITMEDYVEKALWNHSPVLYRALNYIGGATGDLYKIDGKEEAWDSDAARRLRVVVEFVNDAIRILDRKGVPRYLELRIRKGSPASAETIYDHLANVVVETILNASSVTSPDSLSWSIQHNFLWSELFGFPNADSAAAKAIQFKVRRLLFDDIVEMETFPNFKGARILGFCLNMMKFKVRKDGYLRSNRALHTAVLAWTRKHYTWLVSKQPRVAESCLFARFSYDARRSRLVETYPADALRLTPHHEYFAVDRLKGASSGSRTGASKGRTLPS